MKMSRIVGKTQDGGAWHRTSDLQSPDRSSRLTRCWKSARGGGLAGVLAVGLLVAGSVGCGGSASADDDVMLELTPSSTQLAQCMPDASLSVAVKLTTDKAGFDRFEIRAHHLPPDRDFTVFLLEQPGAPFGAAEYIGDFTTNKNGDGQNTFNLVVQEAFSSTIVNGQRVRVDLNEVGVWFADPADDDFCLGPGGGPVTPFDGDNEAGAQVFNSAQTDPLPAP
jgi:hypothetical protein